MQQGEGRMRSRTVTATGVAVLMVLAAVLTGCDWKGKDPSPTSVDAVSGAFAVAQAVVGPGNGFGGGTVYYPTDTSKGRFGGIAVVPGYVSPQSTIQWYGPRLASQG